MAKQQMSMESRTGRDNQRMLTCLPVSSKPG
jgi:hypothetical protein